MTSPLRVGSTLSVAMSTHRSETCWEEEIVYMHDDRAPSKWSTLPVVDPFEQGTVLTAGQSLQCFDQQTVHGWALRQKEMARSTHTKLLVILRHAQVRAAQRTFTTNRRTKTMHEFEKFSTWRIENMSHGTRARVDLDSLSRRHIRFLQRQLERRKLHSQT